MSDDITEIQSLRVLIQDKQKEIENLKDLLRRSLDFAGHAEDVPSKEEPAKQWADEVRTVIRHG